jgi:hypothetical protein
MRAQHSAISRRKFGPTCDADYHNPISEDRRLLGLVGQSMYTAKHHEQRAAKYQEQNHPPPAPEWASLSRLVSHRATDWVTLRGLSDAG